MLTGHKMSRLRQKPIPVWRREKTLRCDSRIAEVVRV